MRCSENDARTTVDLYQRQLANVLRYFEDIVAEGDQGETFAAIDRILRQSPACVDALTTRFLQEPDADRKELLAIILEGYAIDEVLQFLRENDLL